MEIIIGSINKPSSWAPGNSSGIVSKQNIFSNRITIDGIIRKKTLFGINLMNPNKELLLFISYRHGWLELQNNSQAIQSTDSYQYYTPLIKKGYTPLYKFIVVFYESHRSRIKAEIHTIFSKAILPPGFLSFLKFLN